MVMPLQLTDEPTRPTQVYPSASDGEQQYGLELPPQVICWTTLVGLDGGGGGGGGPWPPGTATTPATATARMVKI